MEKPEIERHPLKPFLPPNARLLMLGSFPPPRKRWCMDFFYPNRTNMMWEIFGLVFFGDSGILIDKSTNTFKQSHIESLLRERGIAIYDTACAVRRLSGNASDKDLEIVEKTDIPALLSSIPQCHDIVCTGQKSFSVLWRARPEDGNFQCFCVGWPCDASLAHAVVVARLPHENGGEGPLLRRNDEINRHSLKNNTFFAKSR